MLKTGANSTAILETGNRTAWSFSLWTLLSSEPAERDLKAIDFNLLF